MIHVLAELTASPGMRDRFVEEFRRIVAATRAEAGCIEYVGAMDAESAVGGAATARPDVLTVVEKWESESALAAHLAAAHMDEFRTRTREMTAGVTIRVLRDI